MTNDNTIRIGSRVTVGIFALDWPEDALDFDVLMDRDMTSTVVHLFDGASCPMARVVSDQLADEACLADADGMPTIIAWDLPVSCLVEVSK